LLHAMGNPETHYPSLLVAGTNGKGSVARFISSACSEASLKTGLFTSPHLVSVRERLAIDGQIISVVDGVTQIGQYHVVVLNRGTRDGLAVGDVLSVFRTGETIEDRFGGGKVRLPDEEAGTLMVFKVYDRIVYVLVMEAAQAIHIHDTVRNPT